MNRNNLSIVVSVDAEYKSAAFDKCSDVIFLTVWICVYHDRYDDVNLSWMSCLIQFHLHGFSEVQFHRKDTTVQF